MRKKNILIVIFGLIIIIAALKIIDRKGNENTLSMSALTQFYYSHTDVEYENKLREVKEKIDEFSFEQLVEQYEKIVLQWSEEQKICPIEHIDIAGANLNNKIYNNIVLTIDIYYVHEDAEKTISKNMIYNELTKLLRDTPYGYYKINSIKINLYRSGIDIEKPYASHESILYWQTDIEKRVFIVE